MIYTSENNWYSWQYGDQKLFGRQTGTAKFKTYYSKFAGVVHDFKTELKLAAASTLDHFPGLRPQIFFSGGVDSELILRSYLAIGANPEVFIVRYENDLNLHDISYAIVICDILGVKYNLIDFNLQKFYSNDAELVSEQSQIDEVRVLPHLKFTEVADELIIAGFSDIYWTRMSVDYLKKSTWVARDFEFDIGFDKYNIYHNRAAIYQWWHWTPGLILSYTNLNWFKQLLNDEFDGKAGINSTKILGFKEIFPDLLPRPKYTGFERVQTVITEFQNYLEKKNGGLIYRQEVDRTLKELTEEIL
jgi:hypothetical protein